MPGIIPTILIALSLIAALAIMHSIGYHGGYMQHMEDVMSEELNNDNENQL